MAPRNLIGKLADNAIKSLQDPKGTAGKVVGQAKGTAALGRMVAEHVGRTAVSKAAETASTVVAKASSRKPTPKRATDAPRAEAPAPGHAPLRSVPDANEPLSTPAKHQPAAPTRPPADQVAKAPTVKKPTARKAPVAKKAPVKQVAANPANVAAVVEAAVANDPTRTAAQKAPAKKSSPGDRLPPPKKTE